jgi:hypothetical protein
MKVIKTLLFVGILGVLLFVFKQIYQIEEADSDSELPNISEEMTVKQFADSLGSTTQLDTLKSANAHLSAQIDDYDARVFYQGDSCILEIKKSHAQLTRRAWKDLKVVNLLCSDLNGNQQPEFWLQAKSKKKITEIKAYEIKGNIMITLPFPLLKGRQRFGYVGNDTLYFVKTTIVRSFQFKNDLYSDLGNGLRACYYTLGPDQSFILTKTLDSENLHE